MQPVGERWSDDCLMALQRRVSNRILRVEIQGAHEGKVLVAMIDEGSDPQANIAELLISANYAAPAPHPTVGEQQVDQTAVPAAESQGEKQLKSIIFHLKYLSIIRPTYETSSVCFKSPQWQPQPLSRWSGLLLRFPLMAR